MATIEEKNNLEKLVYDKLHDYTLPLPENDFNEIELLLNNHSSKTVKVSFWRKYAAVAACLVILLAIGGIGTLSSFNKNNILTDLCIGNTSCLCEKRISDLQKEGFVFKEVIIEDNECLESCNNCRNGVWYASDDLKGIVFQKEIDSDLISRVRLTKEFQGKLPNGKFVKLKNLRLKDIDGIIDAPQLYWIGCTDYWSFSAGSFRFVIKAKQKITGESLTTVEEKMCANQPIESIEIFRSCQTAYAPELTKTK